MIKQRPLGSTGINVSEISWGTVKVGRNFKVKNKTPDGFELPDDKIIQEIIGICLEHGINLIDTAPAYGISEERMGKLLRADRKKFIISTKAGEDFDGTDSSYNFSTEHLTYSVERSLKRFSTDYLDSVLLHLPSNDLEILTTTEAFSCLSNLKQQGKIRSFGASTHTVEGGLYTLENSDLAMIPFNPDYQEHLPVIKKAAELKKGITIKKGFNSGFLSEEDKVTAIRNCLQEPLQHPSVSSLVIGSITPKNLLENIKILNEVNYGK